MRSRFLAAMILLLASQALYADEPVFIRTARTEIGRETLEQMRDPNNGEELWWVIYKNLPESMNIWRTRMPTCGPIVILWSVLETPAMHPPGDALRNGIIESDSVVHAVLCYRRKYVWEAPSAGSDIVGENGLLIVVVGNNPKLAEVALKIRNEKSRFERELGDLIELAKGLKTIREGDGALPVSIMEANPDAILPPSRAAIRWSSGTDSTVLYFKERVMLGLRVGLGATQVNLKSFKIENQQLVVSGDETQHADWRSTFAVMLEIHMPRDEEALEPLWGKGVWQGGWDILYNVTLQRLGVVGGIRLSTDPLESWYLGLNYTVTPEIGIIVGQQGINQPGNGTYSIGNITSLSDADRYMKRKYVAPKLFVGLSFTPRAIGKALGVFE
jgi:hypothetical protein